MNQIELNLFPDDNDEQETEEFVNTPTFDRIMSVLDRMNKSIEEDNKMLADLLAELNTPDKEHEPIEKEQTVMAELTVEAIDTLKNSKVEGNVVKLPPTQLDRKTYLEVKNKLELIGGKWKGGKVSGFVFQENPSELLEQIANGDKRNLKKEFQFFGTPDNLADRLVALADLSPNDRVLEPSAGQGAIIKAINRVFPEMMVECFEPMPVNKTILSKMANAINIGDDFLANDEKSEFDKIIANPPFSKNQDIDHIREMFRLLKSGGRLVSIASKHWQLSSNKKETQFKNWIKELNAQVIEVDAGEFKESGTSIATVIIVINKPA